MEARQEDILKLVVEQYVESAEPVGSKFLAEKTNLGVSGATLRNEMRDLEESGFLTHPHTSAGRLPTEAGYRYYVEHLMRPVALKQSAQNNLDHIAETEPDMTNRLKTTARYAAEYSGNAVIAVWNADSFYYTGLSYLFAQPEFQEYVHVVHMSAMFDECEDRLDDIFGAAPEGGVSVLIGSKNPLGRFCSAVVSRPNESQMVAIVGPMRMRYADTVALSRYIHELA